MSNQIALIDVGGTFTKIASIEAGSGLFITQHKYPSDLLWLREDLVAKRIFSELQTIARIRGLKLLTPRSIGLNHYERVYISFPGKINPATGLADLAYFKKRHVQSGLKLGAWPDFVNFANVLDISEDRLTTVVDKVASGISYIARNKDRVGAALTIGTGAGLVHISGRRIVDDITARTTLVHSRLANATKNLHDFIGGNHSKEIALGTSTDVRRSLSFRLVRTLLAIENRLLVATNTSPLLIEVAGGGTEIYDTDSVQNEFLRKRQADTEVRFLADSGFNNIRGLAYLHESGQSIDEFME